MSFKQAALIASAIVVMTAFEAEAGCGDIPKAAVQIINSSPIIDGILSESCWQREADFKDFKLDGTRETARKQTEAWAARNDEWLFFAFRCYDHSIKGKRRGSSQRGKWTKADESVQILISPVASSEAHYCFIVNAGRTQEQYRCEGKSRHIDWNAHWRSATGADIRKGFWTAEVAIPLFYLSGGAPGDEWRLNLVRIKRDGTPEMSSWVPATDGTDSPTAFGIIKGFSEISAGRVFAPLIEAAKVQELQDFPERCYKVTMTLRNDGNRAGVLTAYAIDRTASGQSRSKEYRIEMDCGHTRTMTITVPIDDFVKRSTYAVVKLQDQLGTWELVREIKPEGTAKPLSICMDRSYYTTEERAHLIADITLPERELVKSTIRIKNPFISKDGITSEIRQCWCSYRFNTLACERLRY